MALTAVIWASVWLVWAGMVATVTELVMVQVKEAEPE